MKQIFLLLLLTALAAAKVDIISITPSTWIVSPKDTDSDQNQYYNKLALEGYFSINKFKAYLAVPLAYTYVASTEEDQFGLGDIAWYVGWQFGMVQPRIGMVIPGIYSVKESWIGSQDLRLGAGVAVQPHADKATGGMFSFEATWFPYLSESFGLAEPGSWDITSITKGTYCFNNGWKANGELLFNINSVEWEWTTPDREFKLTAVPVLSGSYEFTDVIEAGVKAGYGPTFAKTGDSDMAYAGSNTSLGIFLNLNL